MQLFKNMEVALMLAFGILCATVAVRPAAHGPRALADDAATIAVRVRAPAAAPAPVPTIHIVGRRLAPAEKRADASPAG